MDYSAIIAKENSFTVSQVSTVLNLFAEGSTVPFIARYRKEKTGGLDEDQLRMIEERSSYLTILNDRRDSILKSIEEQGKLTDELRRKINASLKLQELEDLYLPYKPKRKTRGTIAKAKGLEPLAMFLLDNPEFSGTLSEILAQYINPELGVNTEEEALQGAKDIIAEMISESAEVRQFVRETLSNESQLKSVKREDNPLKDTKNEKMKDKEKKDIYQVYSEFCCDILKLKSYQVLALNRGEEEKFLKVEFVFDVEAFHGGIYKTFVKSLTVFEELFKEIITDSFKRLIFPSVEKEVRNALTELADVHAIEIFAGNLKSLLLQPPLSDKIIMGIDPGYVSGCKIAVIDKTGKYLEGATIYPHEPKSRMSESLNITLKMIKKYGVELVAIGNGTASRETESMVAELIKHNSLDCFYLMVNEAGASVYSASEVAKKEFPDLEASQRGNISIARRALDPLSELVKIDPKSIGVGLYQHDVDQKLLSKKLDDVVISCVNHVGVDVNTASVSLLSYVSGLSKRLADNVVKYRDTNGKFNSRDEVLNVTGVGPKVFEQAAGFLRIPGGENLLDNTSIHPESYDAVSKLVSMFNLDLKEKKDSLVMIDFFIKQKGIGKIAKELQIGEPTLADIVENLKKPGRDPREDVPKPILRSDVLNMEHLKVGMRLKGTVRNVVDFGAFVDIGVKQDGLVHVSQIANKFIKNPLDALKVGDIVDVIITEINVERKRIALSIKDALPPA